MSLVLHLVHAMKEFERFFFFGSTGQLIGELGQMQRAGCCQVGSTHAASTGPASPLMRKPEHRVVPVSVGLCKGHSWAEAGHGRFYYHIDSSGSSSQVLIFNLISVEMQPPSLLYLIPSPTFSVKLHTVFPLLKLESC